MTDMKKWSQSSITKKSWADLHRDLTRHRDSVNDSLTVEVDRQQSNIPPEQIIGSSKACDTTEEPPNNNALDNSPLDWTSFITWDGSKFVGGGGFADVCEGSWTDGELLALKSLQDLPRVVIKKFRPVKEVTKLRFVHREINVWDKLEHENIVTFVGVIYDTSWAPSLVLEYIERGPVIDYLKIEPDVCVRRLIKEICAGLKYLHEFTPSIVHGDIKPDNILVKADGRPCLCDLGLSRILIENTLWHTSAKEARGTTRWMAPELLKAQEIRPTTASDVYSYGLCSFELITGKLPYEEIKTGVHIITGFLSPSPPVLTWPALLNISDSVDDIIAQCWSFETTERPSISDAFTTLGPSCCTTGLSHGEDCIINPFKENSNGRTHPETFNGTTNVLSDLTNTNILEENSGSQKVQHLPDVTKPVRELATNLASFGPKRDDTPGAAIRTARDETKPPRQYVENAVAVVGTALVMNLIETTPLSNMLSVKSADMIPQQLEESHSGGPCDPCNPCKARKVKCLIGGSGKGCKQCIEGGMENDCTYGPTKIGGQKNRKAPTSLGVSTTNPGSRRPR